MAPALAHCSTKAFHWNHSHFQDDGCMVIAYVLDQSGDHPHAVYCENMCMDGAHDVTLIDCCRGAVALRTEQHLHSGKDANKFPPPWRDGRRTAPSYAAVYHHTLDSYSNLPRYLRGADSGDVDDQIDNDVTMRRHWPWVLNSRGNNSELQQIRPRFRADVPPENQKQFRKSALLTS
ncbi:hypothetical protein ACHAXS_014444 [Conticribra weissflogii]